MELETASAFATMRPQMRACAGLNMRGNMFRHLNRHALEGATTLWTPAACVAHSMTWHDAPANARLCRPAHVRLHGKPPQARAFNRRHRAWDACRYNLSQVHCSS
jgi:hypothetical protein